MADDANTSNMQSWISPFLNGIPFKPNWLAAGAETPLNLYATASRQILAATARQLQIQADYVAKLAQCNNPAEALSAQAELVQKSLSSGLESGQQIAGMISKGVSAAA